MEQRRTGSPGRLPTLVGRTLPLLLVLLAAAPVQASSYLPDPDPEAYGRAVSAGGSLSVAKDSAITGDVHANGAAALSSGVLIDGDLSAAGQIALHGATVTGTVTPLAPPQPLPSLPSAAQARALADRVFEGNHSFPSGTVIDDVVFVAGQARFLGSVNGTGTVIAGGQIRFDNVTAGQPAELEPDTRMSFVSLGSLWVGKDRELRGELVAGGAAQLHQGLTLSGLVAVRGSLAVHKEAAITYSAPVGEEEDTEPPQLAFTAPGPVVIGDPMPTLGLVFSDSGSGIDAGSLSVTLDDAELTAACTVGAGAATCPTPELSAGRHSAEATIADLAGNLATATLTFDIVLDLGPPRVTIAFPADGSLVATPAVTIEGTVTTTRSLASLTVDGQPAAIAGANFAAEIALSEGEDVLRVIATDDLDRIGSALISVILDTTPPELTLSSPADGQLINSGSVRVTGEVGDAWGLSSVRVNGEDAPFVNGRFEAEVSLIEGENLLIVAAVDLAGNSAEASREVTRFTLPEVTIDSPDDLAFVAATTVTVAGTVSDDVLSVTVNGVAATLSGASFQADGVPLIEGGNTVTATATGTLGRVATATIHLVRDLTPPRLAVYRPANGVVVHEPVVAVSGLVNDVVPGTVNASEAVVTVNGQPAQVSNRSFFIPEVSLTPGDNLLVVAAEDSAGNTAEEQVTLHFEPPAGPRLRVASGDHQTAEIGSTLADPLVVELLDAAGQPVADRPVVFALRGNNGALEAGRRRVTVVTDVSGRAAASFTLGTRAGVANQVVEASAPGFSGPVAFTATALPAAPAEIVVDSGGLQVGVAGRGVPRPLIAAVIDSGHNRLEGVPVRFRVVKGAGHFASGEQELDVVTDSDGRAIVTFTLDPAEGIANNVVEASIAGLEDGPKASFVASGRAAGPAEETSISGIVLDNSNLPIAGATLRVKGTLLTGVTDAEGQFRIEQVPVGAVKLIVDGSTVERPGSWPDLEFDLVTIPGRDNTVNMPIYLLPLDLGSGLFVDETHGGTLTLESFPGFALEIAPGSVIFPGGGRSGQVSVTVVHNDKVPMVPNFGQQPRMIVTIQPAGARFEPPARLTLPNVEGLAPGEVTEMYSFDHDLGHFVSIGPATVSDDATTIVADPGVGIVKAGWHCGGNPASAGTPHNCPPCQICNGSQCVPGCSLGALTLQPPGSDLPLGIAAAACTCSDGDPCTVNDRCDGTGCVGDDKEIVSVTIVAPAAAKATQAISFIALVEDENCPEGERSYLWDFGDGGISTAASPSHSYAFPGEYTVTVKVSCGGCAGTTKTDTTMIKVIDVFVLSADVVADEIGLLLAPDGVTGDLTVELANPDGHTIVGPAPRAGGSYTESFNIPGLAEGEYQTVRATWEVEGVSVSDERGHHFQVLGNWRHSQYNTPEDTMCGGAPLGCYITTNNAAGATQCFNGPPFTFHNVMLPQQFVDQVNLNGSGRVAAFGDVQIDAFCPGTATAPADAGGHTFRQQAIVPACGLALGADTLAGCLADPDVACGDRIFIHTIGMKTVTDNCPACCAGAQFDNYTLDGACAGILDLGRFMTIKLF